MMIALIALLAGCMNRNKNSNLIPIHHQAP
ncbi:hypothetical protein X548_02955 [Stenotrophomonas maltophilia 5BA-I-2]|nr:hypothetical protein X548_02955 [Stenotrophomonas maltophilia 5BA-I-2]